MQPSTFLDKTKELQLSSERYETITLFELTQLYGSSLCAFLAFILSIPLFLFATMWIALPLCFLILVCGIIMLFDENLWLPDMLKAKALPSPTIKSFTGWVLQALDLQRKYIPMMPNYQQYVALIKKLSPILLIICAFQVGFIQTPHTNTFSVFALFCISLGYFTDDGYITLAGYVAFLLGLI
jgi:hypothetical protein